jgi:hypothetical protein
VVTGIGGEAGMFELLMATAITGAFGGTLVLLYWIPDVAALRDHQARADVYLRGIRDGRAL